MLTVLKLSAAMLQVPAIFRVLLSARAPTSSICSLSEKGQRLGRFKKHGRFAGGFFLRRHGGLQRSISSHVMRSKAIEKVPAAFYAKYIFHRLVKPLFADPALLNKLG